MQAAQACQRGVMVVGVHFMSLELGGRVMGLCQPMMATYRPHNNALMEWVQTRGRMRSNKSMIDRRNLKGLVNALETGGKPYGSRRIRTMVARAAFCAVLLGTKCRHHQWYLCVITPFRRKMLTVTMVRKEDCSGYSLHIGQALSDYPSQDEFAAASYMNKVIEREILRAPEQYLWIHRRFKTRPVGEPSLYN